MYLILRLAQRFQSTMPVCTKVRNSTPFLPPPPLPTQVHFTNRWTTASRTSMEKNEIKPIEIIMIRKKIKVVVFHLYPLPSCGNSLSGVFFFCSDYLKNESLDKKKVPFDSTGWRTVSPKVLYYQIMLCQFVSFNLWSNYQTLNLSGINVYPINSRPINFLHFKCNFCFPSK